MVWIQSSLPDYGITDHLRGLSCDFIIKDSYEWIQPKKLISDVCFLRSHGPSNLLSSFYVWNLRFFPTLSWTVRSFGRCLHSLVGERMEDRDVVVVWIINASHRPMTLHFWQFLVLFGKVMGSLRDGILMRKASLQRGRVWGVRSKLL